MVQIIAALLITYRVAYGSAWVRETSESIFGTRQTQSSGIRVQVEFSGASKRPPNEASNRSEERRDHEMGKLTV
jgi:hypothetical protein